MIDSEGNALSDPNSLHCTVYSVDTTKLYYCCFKISHYKGWNQKGGGSRRTLLSEHPVWIAFLPG